MTFISSVPDSWIPSGSYFICCSYTPASSSLQSSQPKLLPFWPGDWMPTGTPFHFKNFFKFLVLGRRNVWKQLLKQYDPAFFHLGEYFSPMGFSRAFYPPPPKDLTSNSWGKA